AVLVQDATRDGQAGLERADGGLVAELRHRDQLDDPRRRLIDDHLGEEVMGMVRRQPDLIQPGRRRVEPPAAVCVLSLTATMRETVAPSTGRPASSTTRPPIVVPRSSANRKSAGSGRPGPTAQPRRVGTYPP